MPNLQKALAHLLMAVFTLGSVACPCPLQVSDGAGPHAHPGAHHQSHPSANTANGCEHADCVKDCSRISPDSSARDNVAVTCKGEYHFDLTIAPATIFSLSPVSQAGSLTHPPPHSSELSHETPVARFDRLLN
jgi:hypothetical protein